MRPRFPAGAFYFVPLILPLLLGACADIFQGKIPMPAGTSGNGSLETLLNPPRQTLVEVLPSPAQLFVETGGSPSAIRLGWTGVEGASSYVVERAVIEPLTDGFGNVSFPLPGDEHFEILEPFVYGLSYTDKIINNPKYSSPEYLNRYYYRVRAENVGARLEPGAATVPQWGVLFAPPRNVKAGRGASTGEINLEWERVDKAAAYRVYRSDYENGSSPYLLDRVEGPRYRNVMSGTEQGREFYYSVAAESSSGGLSVSSSLAMGFSLIPGVPDKPENAGLAAGSGRGNGTSQITITWAAVGGADYYAVFRSSSADSTLTRITDKTAGTSYIDTRQLKPYVYYYYYIQAIREEDGKVLKSQFSENAVEAFILSPPLTAEALKAGDGTISINWYPALGGTAEQALYSYEIYGDTNATGSFSTLVLSVSAPAAAGEDGYIHGGTAPSYPFYRVKTRNGPAESEPGPVFAPPPRPAVILDASQAAFLSGRNPNAAGVYPVQITWKKPDGEVPAAYHVYRSTSPDTGFRAVTANPIPASEESGGQFTWFDENSTARVRTYYYYRVLSLNSLGQGKYYSETKRGYGAIAPTQFFLEYNRTVKNSHKKLTFMHKPGTAALGAESANGDIGGKMDYNAGLQGLGARITMRYQNYADYYVEAGAASSGIYFKIDGNSNTTADMNSNGSMDGTMTVTEGMYKGTVKYDSITIKGGSAGGGYYVVQPAGFPAENVDWKEGNK
ncbi:MAG: hypothetical protein LBK02_09505 [Treponema sp.]|nr:hypothetical protein [Treponema sp.]